MINPMLVVIENYSLSNYKYTPISYQEHQQAYEYYFY